MSGQGSAPTPRPASERPKTGVRPAEAAPRGPRTRHHGRATGPLRHFWALLLLQLAVTTLGFACARSLPPEAPPAPTRPDPDALLVATDAGPAPPAPTPFATLAAPDAAPSPSIQLLHRGVNLSGGEFGSCCPGTYGRDYAFPTRADVDLFATRRVTHLRLPFRHERLQRQLKTDLDAVEWGRINDVLTYALSKGMTVALEPHNFARYGGVVLTETEMGDLWGRIARRLPADGRVWPNLTNEPRDMPTETWLALAKAAVKEIRRVGFTGRIVVPGNGWTGAAHWSSSWYGRPNSELMQQVTDPGSVFEVHLYLDSDSSGGGKECVSETIGVERLKNFVAWLKTHKRLGYLGEIGAPNTPTCEKAVKNTLASIEAEPALWVGWAWWSAGSRWPATYALSVQPIALDAGAGAMTLGADRPQFEWLRPFLYCGGGR